MDCNITLWVGITVSGVLTLYFIKRFFSGGVCRSKAKLDGKTAIITGANSGIGLETAKDLARRGARVILACRNLKKADEAANEVKMFTDNPSNVIVKHLDLNSLQSVRKFSEEIKQNEPKIDILLNNAGVMWCPYMETEDGFEVQFGVNHLGHFLLTNLLLDNIKAAAPSRIICVSSLGHTFVRKVNFLMDKKSYGRVMAYSNSKLANVLFCRELAKRLQGTGVTVNSLHPGAVRTDLARHIKTLVGVIVFLLWPVYMMMTKTVRQGSQTSIYCAVAEELQTVSGKYFCDCAQKEPSKLAQSDEEAERLWEISEKLVGL